MVAIVVIPMFVQEDVMSTKPYCNNHVWKEEIDSQSHSEYFTAVYCKLCDVPGEKNVKTGEVFYPAT